MMALLTMFAGNAQGEYSKRFEANRSASLKRALAGRQLVIWQPVQDAPMADWAPEVLERIKASTGASGWTSNISRTSASGELWRDGTGLGPRIWDEQRRPKVQDLEQSAYRLAMDVLAPVLVLGAGEELIPWMVVHEIHALESRSGEKRSGLSSSTIKFARLLDGVPVLGGDSYVALTFAVDGSLIRIAYAWPRLERVDAVATVGQEVLLTRAGFLHRTRAGRGARASVDCGYYPAGDNHKYVPACLVAYSDSSAPVPTSWLHVVPLSETVVPVPGWEETKVLTSSSP